MIITLPEPATTPRLVTADEINSLHEKLLARLVMPIYPLLTWSFNDRFTKTYGQAEFADKHGNVAWIVKYSRKYWLLLSAMERQNLVTHEICHLAVEYFHGYSTDGVEAHGQEWRNYMTLCGENPDLFYEDDARGAEDDDVIKLSSLLLYQYENRATKSTCKGK